jgi:hypothetical protein
MATGQAGVSVSARVLGAIGMTSRVLRQPYRRACGRWRCWGGCRSMPGRGAAPRSRRRSGRMSDSAARNSVRTAHWALRRAVGQHADAMLDTSRNRIGLRNVEVDVARFRRARRR